MSREKAPTISVIVPVYNAEKHLCQCIESILQQTYTDIEIILVNDGSSDNSANICERYAGVDKRIRVIHQQNKGVSAARNAGIVAAIGKYIAFIDSDDWISQSFLKQAVELISCKDDDLYICGLQMDFYDNERLNKSVEYTFSHNYKYKNVLEFLTKETIDYPTICISGPWCKLYKREIIKKHALFFDVEMSLGEDAYFNICYLEYCKNVIVDRRVFYHYRRGNSDSLFSRFNPDFLKAEEVVIDAKIKLLKAFDSPQKYIDNLFLLKTKYVVFAADHYYIHSESTTAAQRKNALKELSAHPLLKVVDYRKFSLKYGLIIFLLKHKCFFIVNGILTLKHIIKK